MEAKQPESGDVLFAKSGYHGISKVKVKCLTPTQIVLEGYDTKLRKPFYDGMTAIGTKGYSNTYYYLPSLELENAYRRKINNSFVSTFAWSKLNNEQIQLTVDFLKNLIK